MTYTFKQQIVPSSKYGIKCPNKMTAEYITVHNTANDASAANEIKYMLSNNNEISYHYAVDDKEVIQGLPADRNAWHCGDGRGKGNMKSIGVEICYSKSGGERYTEAEENAVHFIASLLKERGWGIDRIRQHHDWSGKDCPHRIRKEGRWNSFLNRIQAALKSNVQASAEKPTKPNIPTDTKLYRVHTGTFKSVADQMKAVANLNTLFKAQPYDKNGFRVITGTFIGKASAEAAAAKIKEKFGYLVYLRAE